LKQQYNIKHFRDQGASALTGQGIDTHQRQEYERANNAFTHGL
jgi:hypothetical protein